jgi:GMP synthase (glutamine-hydrolysing)
MMQHQTRPFFGVQFHPEVSGNHGSLLIENFVRVAGEIK